MKTRHVITEGDVLKPMNEPVLIVIFGKMNKNDMKFYMVCLGIYKTTGRSADTINSIVTS